MWTMIMIFDVVVGKGASSEQMVVVVRKHSVEMKAPVRLVEGVYFGVELSSPRRNAISIGRSKYKYTFPEQCKAECSAIIM